MKKFIVPLIIIGVIIANLFIVSYGREHFPENFVPEKTSFFENYLVFFAFELGCIAIPLFLIIMILFLIITTKKLFTND